MPTRAELRERRPPGTALLAVPGSLARLSSAQLGVVTRGQLARFGVPEPWVRAELAARRWQAIGRNVVVLQNGALSPGQRDWVGVLLPGKDAALAGLSAAAAGGLQGFAPEHVHVLVAHGTHAGVPGWVALHESRRFTPADVLRGAGPPRTRISRAVIDAATWSARPRRACAILCAAVQQRLTTADLLLRELRGAGPIRHVAIMRDILGDIGGGGHTLAEIDLGPLARQAGLPAPHRQRPRRDPDGKVRYLDIELDLPDGEVLVVEIDGAGHLWFETWLDDADRQNEVVIAGRPVLRFPSTVVRLEPGRVVDQLRRMRVAHAA